MTETTFELPEHLASLGDDAKAVGSAWFVNMHPGTDSELTLQMVQSRPTARTQAALAELVAAGLLSCAPLNDRGGVVYKPLKTFHPLMRWAFDRMTSGADGFILTEKIDPTTPSTMPTMSIRMKS